jgi:hypothetical protein
MLGSTGWRPSRFDPESVDRACQIGYNADMTEDQNPIELLGSPLPGIIWLPHWRVRIGRRGSSPVLVWRVAHSPAPPAEIERTSRFVSVPMPGSEAALKRGMEQLRRRLKKPDSKQPASLEELQAAFHAAGGQVQSVRQVPPGAPPFFGGAGVLDDFLVLADGSDEAIQAFAAHWGPLGICKHQLPCTHSLARRSPISPPPVCLPLGARASRGLEGWEPLGKWRDYARDAKAIVLDAFPLRNRRERGQDQLEHLFGRVAVWLELAAVPLVTYAEVDAGRPWPCGFQATFAIGGVFQILALQLLGVVGGGRELAPCTHCGLPFVLTGHREGKRRFCPSCVDRKIPMRYAARDYRARETGRGRRKARD